VGGVIWQTMHYLAGLRALGCDVHYLELGIRPDASLVADATLDDRGPAAAAFLQRLMNRFDFGDRWAHVDWIEGKGSFGMSDSGVAQVLATADAVINLHGATWPLPDEIPVEKLIYLETDPVATQIELHQGKAETLAYLQRHRVHFTFGENYGRPGCRLPISADINFLPTRQPVMLEYWPHSTATEAVAFTTIGNWKQRWRDVTFDGEVYTWSKHLEFLKFIDLPARTSQRFELALSQCGQRDRVALETKGWRVSDPLAFSSDLDAYRDFIAASRGEFTVAKDQNVRLRTGWFSDRSVTYLAAGRPVVTQETGFSELLPTGSGLFGFLTMDDVVDAMDRINSDYAAHGNAAREVARSHFAHDVVLRDLLLHAAL
jgi:hypothetical protein